MSTATLSIPLLLAILLAGCAAATPPARVVHFADLGSMGPLAPGQSLIVELEKGDTIPLTFNLQGPFLESAKDAPPIPLHAVRHFFLRIDKNGLKSSVDGKTFDWKPVSPGSFRVGLGITKEGARGEIEIHTPVPPGLSQ